MKKIVFFVIVFILNFAGCSKKENSLIKDATDNNFIIVSSQKKSFYNICVNQVISEGVSKRQKPVENFFKEKSNKRYTSKVLLSLPCVNYIVDSISHEKINNLWSKSKLKCSSKEEKITSMMDGICAKRISADKKIEMVELSVKDILKKIKVSEKRVH